jgi:hypothetical protein
MSKARELIGLLEGYFDLKDLYDSVRNEKPTYSVKSTINGKPVLGNTYSGVSGYFYKYNGKVYYHAVSDYSDGDFQFNPNQDQLVK